MIRTRFWAAAVLAAAWSAAQAPSAKAVFIDLIPPPPPGASPFFSTAVAEGRSIIFDANSAFSTTSFGIRLDPLVATFSLRADLYLVAPGTLNRGALLSSSTVQSYTDNGLNFYDVAFGFNFAPGVRYELEIRPPGAGGFGFGQFNVEFFNYQGFPPGSPPNPPYTAGPFLVLDGAGTGVGGPSNTVLAHFRADVVDGGVTAIPEPASLALAGLGALGLAGYRRFRRAPAAA